MDMDIMSAFLIRGPASELNPFAHVGGMPDHFSGNCNVSFKMGPEPFHKAGICCVTNSSWQRFSAYASACLR